MSVPRNIFLLRKSRGGQAVLLKKDDFPIRMAHGGKTYVVNRTKSGKLLMTEDKTEQQ
jgi:hemin uptake protein HemP